MAMWPKAWVYSRMLAGIVGSNLAGGMEVCPCQCCVLLGRGVCIRLISHPEESYWVWSVQSVWPRSPISGGHDPESGQSATGKKYFYLYQWNILTTSLTTIPCFNLYRSSSGYSKCNEVFPLQYYYCIAVFIILVFVVLIFVLGDILGIVSWWCGIDTRLCCLVISKFVYHF
jgi:hypothetical protein